MFFFTISRRKSHDKPVRKSESQRKNKTENKTESKRKRKLRTALIILLASVWAIGTAGVIIKLNNVPDSACAESFGEYSLAAETENQREEFFSAFGYTADSLEMSAVTVPSFGEEFEKYNELQKTQGLSLMPYCGKKAYQYILALKEKSDSGHPLYGVLTVYRGRVIAVHLTDFVCSRGEVRLYPVCS